MANYIEVIKNGYKGYADFFWKEITFQSDGPWWHNYFWALIIISIFFLLLEWSRPWRKNQPRFRKDFWLDFFYMFFNFFLFSLIIYNAASDVVVNFFNNTIKSIANIDLQSMNPMNSWPLWGVFLVGFIVRDFVQWWTHRLLHRFDFLWEYHKVHHSVEQMGFAAHLRYHWMETLVYRTIEYIPLALLGISLYDFFLIHIFTLGVGHFNHSNITVGGKTKGAIFGALVGLFIATTYPLIGKEAGMLPYIATFIATIGGLSLISAFVLGPIMGYLFNSPEMHIWHHAYDIPEERRYGVNFGLTLAIWDYIFGTAYIPHNGRDIRLGFPEIEKYPNKFVTQVTHGLGLEKIVGHKD